MRVPAWLRRKRWLSLEDDDELPAVRSGPAASAAFLLATYEPALWDAGGDAGRSDAGPPSGDSAAASGDRQRWMQDARGWAKNGLRARDKSADPYRDQELTDDNLRRACRAVLQAVTDDSPDAVASALSKYVRRRPA